jgi:hypothetical protein
LEQLVGLEEEVQLGGDGGAAAGLTMPWEKGYDFFKSDAKFYR